VRRSFRDLLLHSAAIRKHFEEKHFRAREKFRPDYRLLASALLGRLTFDSVFDVGCANGFLLEAFLAAGKRIGGIELSAAAAAVLPAEIRPSVAIGDFAQATGRWDLVCCVEVAEHIVPARSAELVEVVAGAADRWVYFTAAPPGQSGRGHINCRPPEDWVALFGAEGWSLDEGVTADLRADLEALSEAHWLRGNSLLLRRT
jgi:SAM-dependent methyltransferase